MIPNRGCSEAFCQILLFLITAGLCSFPKRVSANTLLCIDTTNSRNSECQILANPHTHEQAQCGCKLIDFGIWGMGMIGKLLDIDSKSIAAIFVDIYLAKPQQVSLSWYWDFLTNHSPLRKTKRCREVRGCSLDFPGCSQNPPICLEHRAC